MEHDDDDYAVCAAIDLRACLDGQLARARARLRAAELQLDQLTAWILDGSIDWPVALIADLDENRRQVAAIEHVMADVLGNGEDNRAACA